MRIFTFTVLLKVTRSMQKSRSRRHFPYSGSGLVHDSSIYMKMENPLKTEARTWERSEILVTTAEALNLCTLPLQLLILDNTVSNYLVYFRIAFPLCAWYIFARQTVWFQYTLWIDCSFQAMSYEVKIRQLGCPRGPAATERPQGKVPMIP